MRVLFITRTHPHRPLGAAESRLHDRLRELSELGHDVLVLTKWSGDHVDFELPDRIEVRSPFKSFRAWEWPKSLPMVFAWRPDLLHIYDPGLSTLERSLSVEMMALAMMDTLRRSSRGRSPYLGGLVSVVSDNPTLLESWTRIGAGAVESDWLRPGGNGSPIHPWDRALGRSLRVLLAGRVGQEIPFQLVIDALSSMRDIGDFDLTVFLNRTELSAQERRELARAERFLSANRDGTASSDSATGSRLHLIDPRSDATTGRHVGGDQFDAGIVAGLSLANARGWLERLPMPIVVSETLRPLVVELKQCGMGAQIFANHVTEIAPIAQALRLITDRKRLQAVWSEIEHGTMAIGRDIAANQVSRIYSQIARIGSPS